MNYLVEPRVKAALRQNTPVVALESTVITHGLPKPENAAVAIALENTARAEGAVPATIAILNGKVCVGLNEQSIEELASMDTVRKCSLRDIPIATAREEAGGTTVAATMHVAHTAGIRVFATGGIGGVHRGHPFDVSNDIQALGTIPMTVVCAGAKAILDLSLTLEALETRGVTVVGYKTDELPAFYYRTTGLHVDVRCDTPEEVCRIIRARDESGLMQSILVVNPVPDKDAMNAEEAEEAISKALAEADEQGVVGKATTPFLLSRVSALTDQRSKASNLSLLKNNVRLASQIAAGLSDRL